jgi:death-on-curing protein
LPRSRRHYRVTLDDVKEGHHNALKAGGMPGIRDEGLIEAAIGRPYTGYYKTIHRKAAALVHSLAKNHGFVDGNKRTALFALDLLLKRSGYELRANDVAQLNRDVERMILDVVEDRLEDRELVDWFKLRVVRVDQSQK